MEIYKSAPAEQRRVYLDVPVTPSGGTVDVTAWRDGVLVHTFSTVTAIADGFEVTIPYAYAKDDGEIFIRWAFSYEEDGQVYQYEDTTRVEVVTPLLTRKEILEIHPNATPSEIVAIERAVRFIIQAHTGQRFGNYVGSYNVRGDGSTAMLLPQRLLTLKAVNGVTNVVGWAVEADGWVLKHYPWGVPPVKADAWGLHMHVGGVIHNPNNIKLGLFERRDYKITGEWGWENVPEPVKEAAKLLVNDYACADAAYRDRYLTSMTAADWRIQFHSGAFRETGNVRADQLLNDFVLKRGWAVI